MKTKTSLIIIALLPLFLSLIIILSIYWAQQEIGSSIALEKSADQIAKNAFELNLTMHQYLLYPGERPRIQFRSIHNATNKSLEAIKTKTDEEQVIVKRMQENQEGMGPLFALLVSTHEKATTEEEASTAELRAILTGQILALSREIASDASQLSTMNADRLHALQRRVFPLMLIVALIFGVGLTALSYLMARRVERMGENLRREIVERKRTEEALQQRTLELQHLTETLEERVKERTAELADLSSRLVSAQENERRRVAYDLHDNVWQTLLATRSEIEHLFSGGDGMDREALQDKSKRIMTSILETIVKIRSMQGDLWPYVLDDIGLMATLDWYCREFEKTNPDMTVERQDGVADDEVPSSAKIVIYRILQETLSNVAKYSRATRVTLRLMKKDQRVEFAVEDNGIGFDPEETIVRKGSWGGLGLLSIKARIELSGGAFSVETAKGKGTIIRATWKIDD